MNRREGHQADAAAGSSGVPAAASALSGEPETVDASIAFPEDDAERNSTASPSEFDKYLVPASDSSWNSRQELCLEEQTASLTIQEQQQQQQGFQQAVPSTSGSGYPSSYISMENESHAGASTDITSTVRVTREASNILYHDAYLPQHQPASTSAAPTYHHAGAAVNPAEAQGNSPTVVPFMNTPSPSNSDGSHSSQGTYTSPHYSPLDQAQGLGYGTYSQGQNPQHSMMATSPTYTNVLETSPPTYSHPFTGTATPTYPHPSHPMALAACNYLFGQAAHTYNYQQGHVPPTYNQLPNNPPPMLPHPAPHIPPVNAPRPTFTHDPEDSKVRGGKMYNTYFNNHGTMVPQYDRPARHPSGPTPPPSGFGRVQPSIQYPNRGKYRLPPNVTLSRFFPGFDGATGPYHQPPAAHQGPQALPGFGSHAYLNNGAGPSSLPPPRLSLQLPECYHGAEALPCTSHGFGGARLKTTFNNNNNSNNNNEREPNRESREPDSDAHRQEMEVRARGVARRLSRGVMKRKRGCTCYRCQMVFASSGHLKRHLEAHGSNRRFRCTHPYCDVAYSRQDNLRTHMARAIHRRDGDPYDIPVSDTEDSDTENECNITTDSGIVVGSIEPHDEI